jgi:dihydroflavonol-4-reductase
MILVTGATGCLGSNLTRALVRAGARVAIFRREADELAALADVAHDVEHRLGDLRDPAAVERAMRGVNEVYHVAALAVPDNALRREMTEVNVGGTEHVCAAARRAGVRRLVHTSTASAVGISRDGSAIDERFEFNAERLGSSYIDTKRAAERVVLAHVQRGLDAVIVNPTIVLAPGGSTREGWASLVGRVAQQRIPVLPPGGFGFCAGPDLVDGQLKAMARGRCGERYLLNTQNLGLGQAVQMFARALAVPAPSWRCPAWLARLVLSVAALGSLVAPDSSLLNVIRDNGWIFAGEAFFDHSKALLELELSQSSLEDSVRAMHAWWLECEARQRRTPARRLLGTGQTGAGALP